MEGEDDLARYYERFLALSEPLHFFRYLPKKERNKLFWQGFHPDDRTMLFPYLVNKRPNQLPGDFNFREVFNIAHAVFSRRRLAAEANAACRRKLAREEEDLELEYLIRSIHGLPIHDHTYAILYSRLACRFPDVAEELAKPEPLPEPVQDTPLQQTFHSHHVPSALLPPAYISLPPVPSSAPDLVARTALSPTTLHHHLHSHSRPSSPRRLTHQK